MLQQLKEAQAQIATLKEENMELKMHMNSSHAMRSTMSDFKSTQNGFNKKAQEETFVTMGSENPMQTCDNCSKPVQKSKF